MVAYLKGFTITIPDHLNSRIKSLDFENFRMQSPHGKILNYLVGWWHIGQLPSLSVG